MLRESVNGRREAVVTLRVVGPAGAVERSETMFEVELSPSASEFFAAAARPLAVKLARCFRRLEENPRHSNNIKRLIVNGRATCVTALATGVRSSASMTSPTASRWS